MKMEKVKSLENVTIIKITPTNLKVKDETLPDLTWIDDYSFLEECLKELSKDEQIKKEILNSEKIVLGNNFPYVVKVKSLENLEFDIIEDKTFLRENFKTPSSVMNSADYRFKFHNKHNIAMLFKEKYPEHYNNLDNRYNAIERGGNMVDFSNGKVKLHIFNHRKRSGYVETLCKIKDLY